MQKQRWLYIRLLKEFLLCWVEFKRLYGKYRRGELRFADIASFVDDKDPYSPMFYLKELSHRLFRDRNDEVPSEGTLLDLAIGSIFHEAMKFRENLYQMEVYRPSFESFKEDSSSSGKRLKEEFLRIGKRAERGIKEGIQEMKRLFNNTLEQIRLFMIRVGKGNPLFIRFVVKEERLLRQAYGKRAFEALMAELFPQGEMAQLKESAFVFMESMYFSEASKLWERYLRVNPEDQEASFFNLYCRGCNAYLENRFSQALKMWERALGMMSNSEHLKGYLERMREISHKIAREALEHGKSKEAQKARLFLEKLSLKLRGGQDAYL
jgi:tetratricopeptide (TPR) repeat protein